MDKSKGQSPLKMVRSAKSIVVGGLNISAEHFDDTNSDLVRAEGLNGWEQPAKEPMFGYGMYWDHWFLYPENGGGNLFLFVQIYEHSKGGHTDPHVIALDSGGKIVWTRSFASYHMDQIVIQGDRFWVINRFPKDRTMDNEGRFTGSEIECINLNTGKTISSRRLFYPEEHAHKPEMLTWISKFNLFVKAVSFIEKRDDIYIQIQPSNFSKQIDGVEEGFLFNMAEWVESEN